MTDRARRLAALEASHPAPRGRSMVVLPWDVLPEEREGDMIIRYRLVAPAPDGERVLNYERTGVHPRDDKPGSWNRHLHFGEALA